jgi:hypothetical protein
MILTLENQMYIPFDQILGIFDYQSFWEIQENRDFYERIRSKANVVHGAKNQVKTLIFVQKERHEGVSDIMIYESSIASITLFNRINRV